MLKCMAREHVGLAEVKTLGLYVEFMARERVGLRRVGYMGQSPGASMTINESRTVYPSTVGIKANPLANAKGSN
ncbi:hypothetical protein BHE74_00055558 [Ensete ventricosum]|nr:hypothetical protein BHE74_00055558 [Ensete ventricosum]